MVFSRRSVLLTDLSFFLHAACRADEISHYVQLTHVCLVVLECLQIARRCVYERSVFSFECMIFPFIHQLRYDHNEVKKQRSSCLNEFLTGNALRITKVPSKQGVRFWGRNILKGALKAHKHISLYESYTLQEQDATILFLSVIPWGEIFAYCHPPRQPLPATGCGHVFQVLSAVTQSGGRDHILSPSYLWAVYLTAVLLTRALCTSCIKTYISNKKIN